VFFEALFADAQFSAGRAFGRFFPSIENCPAGTLCMLGLPGVGTAEMLIVGIIALLLFGKNLPSVARNMGKSMAELKKGLSGFQEEFRAVTREAERSMTVDMHDTAPAERSRPAPRPAASAADDFAAPKFDLE
jgi:sec-independent protein translocase protein TatA